jgi:hypothetical protein
MCLPSHLRLGAGREQGSSANGMCSVQRGTVRGASTIPVRTFHPGPANAFLVDVHSLASGHRLEKTLAAPDPDRSKRTQGPPRRAGRRTTATCSVREGPVVSLVSPAASAAWGLILPCRGQRRLAEASALASTRDQHAGWRSRALVSATVSTLSSPNRVRIMPTQGWRPPAGGCAAAVPSRPTRLLETTGTDATGELHAHGRARA